MLSFEEFKILYPDMVDTVRKIGDKMNQEREKRYEKIRNNFE